MLINLEDGRLIAASIAIVGRAENGNQVLVVRPAISLIDGQIKGTAMVACRPTWLIPTEGEGADLVAKDGEGRATERPRKQASTSMTSW